MRMATTAREKAEARYTAEVQRRVEAEVAVAQLTEQNRQLEHEARAWAKAVAEAIVPQLEPTLTASPEPPRSVSMHRDTPISNESQTRSSRAVSELLRESVPVESQERPPVEIPAAVSTFDKRPLSLLERAAGGLCLSCASTVT